mgnify:CR=1 FL=1
MEKITKKEFSGVVVSDKMVKTIVVKIETFKLHPRYGKRYKVSKKYKVHDEKGQYHAGDIHCANRHCPKKAWRQKCKR